MNQEELQQKYLEYQIIDQQIKKIQQQLMILEQQATDMASLSDNLESLKTTTNNTPGYSQIGPGVSVQTTITNTTHVIVNVGADTAVKRTVQEAQDMIKSQIESIGNMTTQLEAQLNKFAQYSQQLHRDLQPDQA